MSGDKRIELRIDSRLDCAALVGVSIRALCQDNGMDDMTAYQVQTAAIEAVNNAIIHAYAGQPGHPVEIHWILSDSSLSIEVRDQGIAMPAPPPNLAPAPEAESGRGWWIMRQWMDSAEYRSDTRTNRVVLRKDLGP